ncbi:MAG: PqiC family protein [Syntrophobacteraceae bacterium]
MIEAPVSRLLAIFIVLMVLGGCAGSKPANYYILRSLQNPGPEVGGAGTENDPAIGVGPVKISQYLDRPEMASRTTQNGLQFAEFDKWAEPLEKNVTRVLADNLSILVPSEHVCTYPWPSSMPVQYQVTLEIIHLEKMADNKILLDTSWNILGNGGEKLLVMKRSRLIMPVESAGFEGMASAESRAVEALSREIAAAVKSLPRDPNL